MSPAEEIKKAKKKLQEWFRAIPEVFLCLGNHDKRVDMKGRHVGLPDIVFRPFRDIWELPDGWRDAFSHVIDGVQYMHGTGYSGREAHLKAAENNRRPTVIGHIHHFGGGGYTKNEKDRIWGMNVGCGINRKAYAFAYGRDFVKLPMLGCGVVTDHGKYHQFFPME